MILYRNDPQTRMTLRQDQQTEIENARREEERLRLQNPAAVFEDNGTYRLPGGAAQKMPTVAAAYRFAQDAARIQFAAQPVFPEDLLEHVADYPDVNPLGNYSEIDLSFSRRLNAVKAAAALCTPKIQQYVQNALAAQNENGALHNVKDLMKRRAQTMRELTRGAKLCVDPRAAVLMRSDAEALKTNEDTRAYEGFVELLEKSVGLRTATTECAAVLHGKLTAQKNEKALALLTPTDIIPGLRSGKVKNIFMDFPNHEETLRQRFWAHPANWEKTSAREPDIEQLTQGVVKLDAEGDEKNRLDYCMQTARCTLQAMYHGLQVPVDTLALVSVRGRTLREMVDTEPGAAQKSEEQKKQRAALLLASAVIHHQHVEAWIPQADGTLRTSPVQITHSGYEPSPIKKVQLNCWENFFHKYFGAYQKKFEAQQEFEAVRAGRARISETVQRANAPLHDPRTLRREAMVEQGYQQLREGEQLRAEKRLQLKEELFTPEQRKFLVDFPTVPGVLNLTYSRTAAHSLAQAVLVNRGYNLDDIFTPGRLLEEKRQAGQFVLQNLTPEGSERLLYEGVRAQRVLGTMRPPVGYFTERGIYNHADTFVMASHTSFDLSQEIAKGKESMFFTAAERVENDQNDIAMKNVSKQIETMEKEQKLLAKQPNQEEQLQQIEAAKAVLRQQVDGYKKVSERFKAVKEQRIGRSLYAKEPGVERTDKLMGELVARVETNDARVQQGLPPVRDWEDFKKQMTLPEQRAWLMQGVAHKMQQDKVMELSACFNTTGAVMGKMPEGPCPDDKKNLVKALLICEEKYLRTNAPKFEEIAQQPDRIVDDATRFQIHGITMSAQMLGTHGESKQLDTMLDFSLEHPEIPLLQEKETGLWQAHPDSKDIAATAPQREREHAGPQL